jgi:hypothetical protein
LHYAHGGFTESYAIESEVELKLVCVTARNSREG